MEYTVTVTIAGAEDSECFDLLMYADSIEELSEEIYTMLME